MNELAKADRRAVRLGVGAATLLAVGGSFWALPHVEDELDEASLEVASYVEADGFDVAWNGRDGFLTVPAGTSPADAERVAADLAALNGSRDVEILFADDDAVADPVEVSDDLAPATFDLSWSSEGADSSGAVPTDAAAALSVAFPASAWESSGDVTLSDVTIDALSGVIAPVVGTEIDNGRITVDDDVITVVGEVPDDATRQTLVERFAAEPSIATVALSVAAAPLANFSIDWDASSIRQEGTAPADLTASLEALGFEAPDAEDSFVANDDVARGLDALAPLVGVALVEGRAEVVEGELSITAVASSQQALDDAASVLDDFDAELSLGPAEAPDSVDSIQDQLDEALAAGVEFETNTNVPTASTEAVIDAVAAILDKSPDIVVEVVGHTDSRGDADANQALSEARARAVVDGLVARGIQPERLTASGRGESEPVASNETAEGQQRNRRVDITIKESGS